MKPMKNNITLKKLVITTILNLYIIFSIFAFFTFLSVFDVFQLYYLRPIQDLGIIFSSVACFTYMPYIFMASVDPDAIVIAAALALLTVRVL